MSGTTPQPKVVIEEPHNDSTPELVPFRREASIHAPSVRRGAATEIKGADV